MRHKRAELWNVQEAANSIPGARETFKAAMISAASRMTLANAAAATSSSVDELTAVIGYRLRNAAQQPAPAQTEVLAGFEAEVTEGDLVA
ncbi:MAG: hypothetical protein HC893_14055 [Chloroflexaceae bacterium]|nr:hypothetical protein [Chloroflexaceae bacterium]NJL34763.1 hypothetical protein [Chloroflexaceae bacterium]NJO05494.1 hypothetical protein [Chloroflexaceae bacterium]